jgi:predicted ATPase
LPQTRKRDEQELEILILLGAALVATQGYAATDVGRVYDRARLLCEFLNARQPYFPVLWGSWVFNVVRANFQTAREFANRFQRLADDCGNTTLVAAGHFMMACTAFHVGKPAETRQEATAALAKYDPKNYPFLLHEYGPELGVFCECYLAHSLWILGHPQQSRDRISSALTRARELGDPFSITLALVYSAMLHQFLGDASQSMSLAEEAAALCDEYGFSYYQAWPPIIKGWALATSGEALEGTLLIRKGIDGLRKIQSRIREPYYLGLLANACIAAGHVDESMAHIRDAFALVEQGGEIWAEPEIHRIKGDILQAQGDTRAAELSYQRAYSLAGRQDAAAFALRAAVSLGKMWTMQGKRAQSQKLLRELRVRFAGQEDGPEFAQLLRARARHQGSSK